MAMLSKIGRLFRIQTRFEAWAVIYAIAVGAVERGHHYMLQYPGFGGWLLALACTAVVFVAGARLLDSVQPEPQAVAGAVAIIDNRPTARRERYGSTSRLSFGRGSHPARRLPARPAELQPGRTHSPDR